MMLSEEEQWTLDMLKEIVTWDDFDSMKLKVSKDDIKAYIAAREK